jgi:hypothetical protein
MKRFIRSSSSQESALQESHEARRFYTARVKSGQAQDEHITSALPPKADMRELLRLSAFCQQRIRPPQQKQFVPRALLS